MWHAAILGNNWYNQEGSTPFYGYRIIIKLYSGVFLELNGVRLLNDSLIDIDDIPDEATLGFNVVTLNALNCITDLVECCNAG